MQKKKDILFLCQFFYPEYISSATLPYDTAVALKNAGYSVDVICGYPREYSDAGNVPLEETVDGIHIRRVKYIQADRKGKLGRLLNFFSFTFMVLLRLFSMAKYRAVMVYSNPPILPVVAWLARRLFGTKLVFVAYDLYPEIAVESGALRQGDIISRTMNRINEWVFRSADAVVALSEEMKTYILAHRPVAGEKVFVIPNWYRDEGALACCRETNSFTAVVGDRMVVSYFGNMGTIQDMQTICDAIRLLKENPHVCFLIAGHGNKMPAVKEMVASEGIPNVFVYDFLKGDAFRDALQISDCAIVSIGEAFMGMCVPSKTYSYMMQGLPLIAIMGPCDIVSDVREGAGIWVRNGDAENLAAEILALQAHPENRRKMAQRCRELYLEKYTTPICTGKYVEMFRQILQTGTGRK